MEDFTGGVTETVNLQKDVPKDLFTVMCKGFERKALMGCAVEVSNLGSMPQGQSGPAEHVLLINPPAQYGRRQFRCNN